MELLTLLGQTFFPRFWRGILAYAVLFFSLFNLSAANTDAPQPIGQTIPFAVLPSGQYVIDVIINGKGPYKFMIDTAATRTSIFAKTQRKLKLKTNPGAPAFINGITTSRYRPSAHVNLLSFAGHSFPDHNLIILKDWEDMDEVELDGILGIDVMANLTFAFDQTNQQIRITRYETLSRIKLRHWKKIKLKRKPYSGKDYGLYFMTAKIGRRNVPTMLDTGANFTSFNWKSVQGTAVEKELKHLRENWIVKGSVGEFKPQKVVRFDLVTIGRIRLKNHRFLMMNFDNLPINNNGKYPLAIAGTDVLGGRDFILDFPNRHLYLAPPKQRDPTITFQTIPTRIK